MTGTIPESPPSPANGNLYWKKLDNIYMDNNMLTGTIPQSLDNSQWKRLILHQNQLSGTISEEGQANWYNVETIMVER